MLWDHRVKGKRGIGREQSPMRRYRRGPSPPEVGERDGCQEQRTKNTVGYEITN